MSVELEWQERVAVIRLERPERHNALDAGLWAGLREKAHEVASEDVRAVVLCGAGEHFCSGMDLKPDNKLVQRLVPLVQQRDSDGLRSLIHELKGVMGAFATMPCPVIAAIEGGCFGAGLELALAADLRVASRSARFSLPETRWGMVPDVGGTVRLSRLVGHARATQLALLGQTLDAETAVSWGLCNTLVETGAALDTALAWARRVCEMSPAATRETLFVLRQYSDDDRFASETQAGVSALLSGEVFEGMASFGEKRAARW